MTVEERRLLTALANCRLPHGSPHKGLCLKILKAVTKSGRYRLTGEQRATLWRLGHYYRARLPEDVQDILSYRKVPSDLSPKSHPLMSRVRSSFEPVWLGGATGRGAKPGSERSVPSRCMAEALSLA